MCNCEIYTIIGIVPSFHLLILNFSLFFPMLWANYYQLRKFFFMFGRPLGQWECRESRIEIVIMKYTEKQAGDRAFTKRIGNEKSNRLRTPCCILALDLHWIMLILFGCVFLWVRCWAFFSNYKGDVCAKFYYCCVIKGYWKLSGLYKIRAVKWCWFKYLNVRYFLTK